MKKLTFGLLLLLGLCRPGHTEDIAITTASATSEIVAPVQVSEPSALDARRARESEWRRTGLLILPYRPNYLMPYSKNFDGNVGGIDNSPNALQDVEAKFQFSLRMPIARGLFWNHGDLQIAYTQLSFWQAYNKSLSAPFRETDYEPEAMLVFDSGFRFLGSTRQIWTVGVDHQSNGREDPDSRSWNRVVAEGVFAKGNGTLSIRPWIRINEPAADDNNPDMLHYMGHFEIRESYKWHQQVGSLMFRDNLEKDNKGAVEVSYSFPLVHLLRGYVQYFYGYGESLIDYNQNANRISVGLAFSDWL